MTAQSAAESQLHYLQKCQELFADGRWPLSLVDVEPLLDPRRVVVYYFGPHHLDTEGFRAAALDLIGLELVLEPIGSDHSLDELVLEEPLCSSCGKPGNGGGACTKPSTSCASCALAAIARPAR